MKDLTYVTEYGEVLFSPDGCDEDAGYTITQLAEMGEYKYLEIIAERLANREQYCEYCERILMKEDETILDVIKHNTSLEMAYFIEKMYRYIEEGKFKTTNDIQDYLNKRL